MKSTVPSTACSAAIAINSPRLHPPRLRRLLVLATLAALLPSPGWGQTPAVRRQQAINQWPAARSIDRAKLTRAGLRILPGKYVTLVTDLEGSPEIDSLPGVLDAAVPLLAEYFHIEPAKLADWKALGMVMHQPERFAAAGLMPRGDPEFPEGLALGYEFWVHQQPTDYYRRHLLLHELVHSFMATQFGECGPGWYMEGMAELLGTHTWTPQRKHLVLGVMPPDRQATPMWGRIKLVRDGVANRRALTIPSVMKIDNRQALPTDQYAWCWALAKFLDTHPRYQERFRRLAYSTLEQDFNALVRQQFARDWSDLDTEWRVYVASLEYGHDIAREAIDFQPATKGDDFRRVNIKADRGWQATPWRVEQGRRYELRTSGRFVIGHDEDGTPWPAEGDGITLEYHRGFPVGQLLAAIDDRPPEGTATAGTSGLVLPQSIGARGTLVARQSGTVYLRLNDSPASLEENRGGVTVSIEPIR